MSADTAHGAHPSDDRWIDLSQGLLDPATQLATLAHLRVCAACELRFREVCREAELLELDPVPALTVRPRRRVSRTTVWAVSLATAALALLAIFRLVEHDTARDLSYRLPVRSESVILRSLPGDADSASLLAAVEAYGHDDFGRVVALLEGRELGGELDFLNLYYASALVWKERYRDAQAVLERLHIETLPQPYRDRARRILYAALRLDGRNIEADRILDQLAAAEGVLGAWARDEITRARGRPAE